MPTKTLRLVLGDQLNINHSWFSVVDDTITYVVMEIRTETDYATHHIQKVVGFFAAMRSFAFELIAKNHQVIYIKLNDEDNLQSFQSNIRQIVLQNKFTHFEYQWPDEYRLDQQLKNICQSIGIPSSAVDSEHFFTTRDELGHFFNGKKTFLLEFWYQEQELLDGR